MIASTKRCTHNMEEFSSLLQFQCCQRQAGTPLGIRARWGTAKAPLKPQGEALLMKHSPLALRQAPLKSPKCLRQAPLWNSLYIVDGQKHAVKIYVIIESNPTTSNMKDHSCNLQLMDIIYLIHWASKSSLEDPCATTKPGLSSEKPLPFFGKSHLFDWPRKI